MSKIVKKEISEKVKEEKSSMEKSEEVFSKRQLIHTKKYSEKKDILNALLQEGKFYTMNEVDELVIKYLVKEVK